MSGTPYIIYQEPSPEPQLVLPGTSDLALALREPALLVPGRQPIGAVRTIPQARLSFGTLFRGLADLHSPAGSARANTGWELSGTYTISVERNWRVIDGTSIIYKNDLSGTYNPSTTGFSGAMLARPLIFDSLSEFRIGRSTDRVRFIADTSGWTVRSEANNTDNASFEDVLPCRLGHDYLLLARYATSACTLPLRFSILNLTTGEYISDSLTPASADSVNNTGYAIGYYSNRTASRSCGLAGGWFYADYQFSDSEFQQLRQNPYRYFLEPANSSPYLFPVATGGGVTLPTLSDPVGYNITSNSFQPRVTATYS
jgi:hypothetical protein